MRETEYTRKVKRDYRREHSGVHGGTLEKLLSETVALLAADKPLRRRSVDHALSGDWIDHRDCHIRPDLGLIDQKPDASRLVLVRRGSHSELGL